MSGGSRTAAECHDHTRSEPFAAGTARPSGSGWPTGAHPSEERDDDLSRGSYCALLCPLAREELTRIEAAAKRANTSASRFIVQTATEADATDLGAGQVETRAEHSPI